MLSTLRAILRTLFSPPICPWTGEPCPAPDKCGFYTAVTICHRDTVERNV